MEAISWTASTGRKREEARDGRRDVTREESYSLSCGEIERARDYRGVERTLNRMLKTRWERRERRRRSKWRQRQNPG